MMPVLELLDGASEILYRRWHGVNNIGMISGCI